MATVTYGEVFLSTVWTAGIFAGHVDIAADAGFVVALTLGGGVFDGKCPCQTPVLVSNLLCPDAVGFVNLGALA